MDYTNQAFKEDLQRYLKNKRAQQEKKARMPWFFKPFYSDPCYQVKIEFVDKLIREIDLIKDEDTANRNKTRPFRRLLRSGINGKEGFEYTVIQSATSVLYLTLLKKDNAIQKDLCLQEEQKSYTGYKKPR